MLTIAELKSALLQQVANTEDRKVLQKIQTYVKQISKNDKKIVGYNSSFKPLTVEQYRKEVKKSLAQYKSGRVVSQEEMETP
jgi:ABC-type Zn uptake system ZnuABC Zn-binding protein ZnuA